MLLWLSSPVALLPPPSFPIPSPPQLKAKNVSLVDPHAFLTPSSFCNCIYFYGFQWPQCGSHPFHGLQARVGFWKQHFHELAGPRSLHLFPPHAALLGFPISMNSMTILQLNISE